MPEKGRPVGEQVVHKQEHAGRDCGGADDQGGQATYGYVDNGEQGTCVQDFQPDGRDEPVARSIGREPP
ncbi:hypothetical protein [Micromonospora sp. NPDC005806]|uniref:hypothetical protein n=1 Tax=Micromonospora sp. NPDC005806 TaxID=3364234 RepID=UPI0036C18C65